MITELLDYYVSRSAELEQAAKWLRIWSVYKDLVRLNDLSDYDMQCAERKYLNAQKRLFKVLGD